MKRALVIGIAMAALGVGATASAQPPRSAEVQMKAAQHKAEIEGDLKGAIEEFRKIVAAAGGNRGLAAQALLQMAECYQKLGDIEAQAIYQRLVREYGDQKDAAAVARARLGGAGPSQNTIALRKVLDGGFFGATVSPDGRYLAHHGAIGTELILRDVSTGANRALDTTGNSVGDSRFSRDGSQIAYTWCAAAFGRCELRIVRPHGANKQPRTLFTAADAYVGAMDWSPDAKSIAVYLNRQDDRILQLGLINTSDGALRVLKTVEWGGGAIAGSFSADGRDIAFDARVAEDTGKRDVYLMAVDASRLVPIVVNRGDDFVLGWTPDGKHLLFGSDRNGDISLWAQAVADRTPQGSPALVKANIGPNVGLVGMTRSGTLHLGIRTRMQNIEVASIDPATLAETGSPTRPIRSVTEYNHAPGWSPDGRFMAYISFRRGENILGIRSTESGAEREVNLGTALDRVASQISWAPDGSFVTYGRDLKGRYGTFRIDADTPTVTPIEFMNTPQKPGRAGVEGFFWSPDGKTMYYRVATGGLGSIWQRDLSSRTERVAVEGAFRSMSLSPDGRWFAALRLDGTTESAVLVMIPVAGGEPRELWRGKIGGTPQWAPDGRAVVVMKSIREGSAELWVVPVDGGAPHRLDSTTNRAARDFQAFRLRPDGRQIAYVVGEDRAEVWAVENFLPVLNAIK